MMGTMLVCVYIIVNDLWTAWVFTATMVQHDTDASIWEGVKNSKKIMFSMNKIISYKLNHKLSPSYIILSLLL